MDNDLQVFIDTFKAGKYKVLRNGIEIRGNIDIHKAINLANEIIRNQNLKLYIKHTADMVGYGAFEVLFLDK